MGTGEGVSGVNQKTHGYIITLEMATCVSTGSAHCNHLCLGINMGSLVFYWFEPSHNKYFLIFALIFKSLFILSRTLQLVGS